MKERNIAIVTTNLYKYSETFIHAHYRLPRANIHILYAGYLPQNYRHLRTQGSLWPGASLFQKLGFAKKQNEQALVEGIATYLLQNRIEAVLCEYGPSGVEMMSICSKLKLPLFVHFHGYDAYRQDVLNSYGTKYPELFETAAGIVVVSEHMKTQLEKLGCKSRRVKLLPYGINTGFFKPGRIKCADFTFVACGRFVDKKAPHITIGAFATAKQKRPDLKLLMIGDGELLDACKALVAELNIVESVTFLGPLEPGRVAEIMGSAHVFVQHSVNTATGDSEGTPLAILEAGACGLPAIATRHGGIPDVISDGINGFLIEQGDEAAMAKKMLELATNAALAEKMGREARRRIESGYTEQKYLEAIRALIETGLNG